MRNLLIESHSRIHMKININVRGMAWRSARPSAPAESARVEAKLRCETFAIKLKELSIRQTKPKALTPPPNRSPSTIGVSIIKPLSAGATSTHSHLLFCHSILFKYILVSLFFHRQSDGHIPHQNEKYEIYRVFSENDWMQSMYPIFVWHLSSASDLNYLPIASKR